MMNEIEPSPARTEEVPAAGAEESGSPVEERQLAFADFMKIDLRVARVVAAEAIPKSKKLLRVIVDDGNSERTLVSGIARSYEPEALVGRSVVIVGNLDKYARFSFPKNTKQVVCSF